MTKSTSACCTREGTVASWGPSPWALPKRLIAKFEGLSAIVYLWVVFVEGQIWGFRGRWRGRSSSKTRSNASRGIQLRLLLA